MSEPFDFDVFLSHNSKDKPRVRRLAERLRGAGLRVWFDEWIVQPGDDIYLAIERGLDSSRVQVLCLSQAALESEWVGLERSTVLFRDPSNAARRFVPLLLDDCELPDTLRRYKHVDFRRATGAAFDALLAACRGAAEQVSREQAESSQPGLPETSLPAKAAEKSKAAQPKPETEAKPAIKPKPRELLALLEKQIYMGAGLVHNVAISPDSQWFVAGLDGRDVWVMDILSGSRLGILQGHKARAAVVCITADGKRIITGDTTVRVWDAANYQHLSTLDDHNPPICVVSLGDGKRVLSSSWDRTLREWDIASGECLKTLEVSDAAVDGVSVSRDGRRAISCQRDGKIKVWDLATSECMATLTGHSDAVRSIQMTPDGRYALSGSDDKSVKIWDLDMSTCIGTLEGHKKTVPSVAISPDGTLAASSGFLDRTVRLWDWKDGTCLQMIIHNEAISPTSVTFTPDGSRLLVGTDYGIIYVYRLTGVNAAPAVEPTRRYVNAKVVLLGESTVGKTTLAHRLIDDDYVKTDSTHGMNVWPLNLPLEPHETLEREALLWDLAGQEDYRLIHQLYLEETALALLLINPQKDDPFAEAGDWLKALCAAVSTKDENRDVGRILIPTRLDVGGMKVSQRKIDRFVKDHGFVACLPTSAKRGDNCSDKANGNQPSKLKELIAQHIPWDKLPWTSTPRLLADIKSAVMALRDQEDIRLLRFAELAQRLKQVLPKAKFGEADVRTAVTLLGNHGLVRPLQFGDLVLLRPDLLSGYAGAIIRAARAHTDELGCVAEEAVYRDDFDFTGVERLKHRPDEELLLRALVQTLLDSSLCIRESEGGEWLLVFPSQYRRDREIPGYPAIFVTYTFNGELQTAYTTLVVRLWYSRTFGRKELWQNAAEFTTSRGHAAGVVFEKLGDGEGKLSVFFDTGVPDELKVVFIEFVRRHLAKYGRDLRRERRYVCVCGAPVKDPDAVEKRIKAGKDFITCQICDGQVPFKDHIEEQLASDPVARQVVAMDQRATQELDSQALEQILIGHMQAVCGEANQIFRELTKFDDGINGEVEFKDNHGKPSGRKIYVQLKSGASYLRMRKADGKEIFDVASPRHLERWVNQPVDVYLVIRDAHETIRWMNVSEYLRARKDKSSRKIGFEGEKLDLAAVWRVRDRFFDR